MAYLTVRCPRSGKLVATSVRIRTLDALDERGTENRVRCEHCGDWHDFDIATAVVVAEDGDPA